MQRLARRWFYFRLTILEVAVTALHSATRSTAAIARLTILEVAVTALRIFTLNSVSI